MIGSWKTIFVTHRDAGFHRARRVLSAAGIPHRVKIRSHLSSEGPGPLEPRATYAIRVPRRDAGRAGGLLRAALRGRGRRTP